MFGGFASPGHCRKREGRATWEARVEWVRRRSLWPSHHVAELLFDVLEELEAGVRAGRRRDRGALVNVPRLSEEELSEAERIVRHTRVGDTYRIYPLPRAAGRGGARTKEQRKGARYK